MAQKCKSKNKMGNIGMYMCIVGAFLSMINEYYVMVSLTGLCFSLIAIFRKPRKNAMIGLLVSVVNLIILTYK